MRQVDFYPVILDTEGLTFHVTTLRNVIPDGPEGIFIQEDLLKQNPVLKTVVHGDITYRFVAIDPLVGIPEDAPIHTLLSFAKRSLPNNSEKGSIEVYAEWTNNYTEIEKLLEDTIDTQAEPPHVKEIAHALLQEAYEYSYDFINVLRRKYLQYWLLPPEPDNRSDWGYLLYYSSNRQSWYSITAAKNFSIKPKQSGNRRARQPHIIMKVIENHDIEQLSDFNTEAPYSFAEEMIATSLVELTQSRLRSAIVHAVIALESSARKGLEYLLTTRLAGLEQGSVLNAIAKEVSTVTLARVVHSHIVTKERATAIDWTEITTLYNVRNNVVHRDQRRLPSTESIKKQSLEVFTFVQDVERELR